MRFTDVRHVPAPAEDVWTALHDREVLRMAIPAASGCSPVSAGRYAATLAARVGRLADTYRGTFAIDDTDPRLGARGLRQRHGPLRHPGARPARPARRGPHAAAPPRWPTTPTPASADWSPDSAAHR